MENEEDFRPNPSGEELREAQRVKQAMGFNPKIYVEKMEPYGDKGLMVGTGGVSVFQEMQNEYQRKKETSMELFESMTQEQRDKVDRIVNDVRMGTSCWYSEVAKLVLRQK